MPPRIDEVEALFGEWRLALPRVRKYLPAARDYLERVAPHVIPTMAEIAPFLQGMENPHLSFDIASEVLPRIGLEGAFPRQPQREPRWAEILGRLVEGELCSPAKREAVR